jgi:hypothetical protein
MAAGSLFRSADRAMILARLPPPAGRAARNSGADTAPQMLAHVQAPRGWASALRICSAT